jgi:electron transfer flavoprotein beta subunit
VIAVSAGPARVAQVLREALARGADRALHVEDDGLARADASVVAEALAAAIGPETPDLVLTGLQSDDMGFGQTGVILAERLGVAHATIIMDVQVQGAAVRVKRELEGGWFQWLEMPLPALLTIQSGINQLRYATLKGIMAAKKKEIRVVAAPGAAAAQRVLALRAPEKQKQTRMIAGSPAEAARELVRALREDARVVS